jgi:hypothetical protein
VVTTDKGTGYPNANYAVWSNLTASSFTMTMTKGNNNNGVNGRQIVMHSVAPPAWLSAHGITSNQDQAENNPDVNGVPIWKDYYAGTDPNVTGSVFGVLALGTNRSITWYGTTNSGVTNGFKIYRNTNLVSGSWQLIGSNITRSGSGTNTWTDPAPPAVPYRMGCRIPG